MQSTVRTIRNAYRYSMCKKMQRFIVRLAVYSYTVSPCFARFRPWRESPPE